MHTDIDSEGDSLVVSFQCQDVFFHVTMTTRRSTMIDDMRQIRTTIKQPENSLTKHRVRTYAYDAKLRLLLEIKTDATHIRLVFCDTVWTWLQPEMKVTLLLAN